MDSEIKNNVVAASTSFDFSIRNNHLHIHQQHQNHLPPPKRSFDLQTPAALFYPPPPPPPPPTLLPPSERPSDSANQHLSAAASAEPISLKQRRALDQEFRKRVSAATRESHYQETPIFDVPVKVSPCENDESRKLIKEALGDYDQFKPVLDKLFHLPGTEVGRGRTGANDKKCDKTSSSVLNKSRHLHQQNHNKLKPSSSLHHRYETLATAGTNRLEKLSKASKKSGHKHASASSDHSQHVADHDVGFCDEKSVVSRGQSRNCDASIKPLFSANSTKINLSLNHETTNEASQIKPAATAQVALNQNSNSTHETLSSNQFNMVTKRLHSSPVNYCDEIIDEDMEPSYILKEYLAIPFLIPPIGFGCEAFISSIKQKDRLYAFPIVEPKNVVLESAASLCKIPKTNLHQQSDTEKTKVKWEMAQLSPPKDEKTPSHLLKGPKNKSAARLHVPTSKPGSVDKLRFLTDSDTFDNEFKTNYSNDQNFDSIPKCDRALTTTTPTPFRRIKEMNVDVSANSVDRSAMSTETSGAIAIVMNEASRLLQNLNDITNNNLPFPSTVTVSSSSHTDDWSLSSFLTRETAVSMMVPAPIHATDPIIKPGLLQTASIEARKDKGLQSPQHPLRDGMEKMGTTTIKRPAAAARNLNNKIHESKLSPELNHVSKDYRLLARKKTPPLPLNEHLAPQKSDGQLGKPLVKVEGDSLRATPSAPASNSITAPAKKELDVSDGYSLVTTNSKKHKRSTIVHPEVITTTTFTSLFPGNAHKKIKKEEKNDLDANETPGPKSINGDSVIASIKLEKDYPLLPVSILQHNPKSKEKKRKEEPCKKVSTLVKAVKPSSKKIFRLPKTMMVSLDLSLVKKIPILPFQHNGSCSDSNHPTPCVVAPPTSLASTSNEATPNFVSLQLFDSIERAHVNAQQPLNPANHHITNHSHHQVWQNERDCHDSNCPHKRMLMAGGGGGGVGGDPRSNLSVFITPPPSNNARNAAAASMNLLNYSPNAGLMMTPGGVSGANHYNLINNYRALENNNNNNANALIKNGVYLSTSGYDDNTYLALNVPRNRIINAILSFNLLKTLANSSHNNFYSLKWGQAPAPLPLPFDIPRGTNHYKIMSDLDDSNFLAETCLSGLFSAIVIDGNVSFVDNTRLYKYKQETFASIGLDNEKLPLVTGQQLHHIAKGLKRLADRQTDKDLKKLTYLDAIVYFVLYGDFIENNYPALTTTAPYHEKSSYNAHPSEPTANERGRAAQVYLDTLKLCNHVLDRINKTLSHERYQQYLIHLIYYHDKPFGPNPNNSISNVPPCHASSDTFSGGLAFLHDTSLGAKVFGNLSLAILILKIEAYMFYKLWTIRRDKPFEANEDAGSNSCPPTGITFETNDVLSLFCLTKLPAVITNANGTTLKPSSTTTTKFEHARCQSSSSHPMNDAAAKANTALISGKSFKQRTALESLKVAHELWDWALNMRDHYRTLISVYTNGSRFILSRNGNQNQVFTTLDSIQQHLTQLGYLFGTQIVTPFDLMSYVFGIPLTLNGPVWHLVLYVKYYLHSLAGLNYDATTFPRRMQTTIKTTGNLQQTDSRFQPLQDDPYAIETGTSQSTSNEYHHRTATINPSSIRPHHPFKGIASNAVVALDNNINNNSTGYHPPSSNNNPNPSVVDVNGKLPNSNQMF